MAGRLELMIALTSTLTLAFLLACIATGTNNWITLEQTGKNPKIISLYAKQGIFERCNQVTLRSRMKSHNCYSLADAYEGKTKQTWENAVAGLMLTATLLVGFAALFNGVLMLSDGPRSGILNDMVPVLVSSVSALLAIIALSIYNSKFESTRKRLIGPTINSSEEVFYGYSIYVGWLAVILQLFAVFFFFVYSASVRKTAEDERRTKQGFGMGSKA